jgi:hypothetical protein
MINTAHDSTMKYSSRLEYAYVNIYSPLHYFPLQSNLETNKQTNKQIKQRNKTRKLQFDYTLHTDRLSNSLTRA